MALLGSMLVRDLMSWEDNSRCTANSIEPNHPISPYNITPELLPTVQYCSRSAVSINSGIQLPVINFYFQTTCNMTSGYLQLSAATTATHGVWAMETIKGRRTKEISLVKILSLMA